MDTVSENAVCIGVKRLVRSRRRWQLWSAAIVTPAACIGEAGIGIRGTVVSATDRAPLAGAEVRMYFDQPDSWSKTCEQLQKPFSVVSTNASGYFKTETDMYPAGCDADCKRGVLCIALDGYTTLRQTFDDCEQHQIVNEDNLVFELAPTP
jgi:hypothetical protein